MLDIQALIDSASDKACFVCKTPQSPTKRGGKQVLLNGKQIWLCATDAPPFLLARSIGNSELHNRVVNTIVNMSDQMTGYALKEEVFNLIPPSRRHLFLQSGGLTKITERSPREIYDDLSRSVVGQQAAKQMISLAVYAHVKCCNSLHRSTPENNNIILVGPSGSGKTLLAQCVSQSLAAPFVSADSTKFSPTGFIGQDAEQVIKELYLRAKENVDQTERGVIFMDEIDKIAAARQNEIRFDSMTSATQATLLRLMEGHNVKVNLQPMGVIMGGAETVNISTAHMLWMLGGAFLGLDEIVAEILGFKGRRISMREDRKAHGVEKSLQAHAILSQAPQEVLQEGLIKFGMMPELIGRTPVISVLAPLTQEQLLEVLQSVSHSPVGIAQRLFAESEYTLEFDPEALSLIAKKANLMATGTRALTTLVKNAVSSAAFKLLEARHQVTATSNGNPRGVVRITPSTLENPEKYELIQKRISARPLIDPCLKVGHVTEVQVSI